MRYNICYSPTVDLTHPFRLLLNGVSILVSWSHQLCSQPLAPIALDYPPFFAYFEKLLSIPAALIDPQIVKLENLNYDAWSVIAYQRTTVILTELVLGAVLVK